MALSRRVWRPPAPVPPRPGTRPADQKRYQPGEHSGTTQGPGGCHMPRACSDWGGVRSARPYWRCRSGRRHTAPERSECPMGSYDRVGTELARYVAVGYRSFILDIPGTEEELQHANQAFRRAGTLVTS